VRNLVECPACGHAPGIAVTDATAGKGLLPFQRWPEEEDDNNDQRALRHFEINEAVRAATTHTESTVRRDARTEQISAAHHARMEADRQLRDQKLSNAWRDGNG
jgi:hypothetical protein